MAFTVATIKKKLKEIGVYNDSMTIAINELVKTDKEIDELLKQIKKEGYSLKEKTREGNIKTVAHPLLSELSKAKNLKQKLLNDLLLTPSALKKNGVELTKTNDDDFEDALKIRV